jgi:hypothetical protein
MSFSAFLKKDTFNKNQIYTILFYGILLFIYVAFRSFNLSFTYDEVVSFNEMKIVNWENIGKDSNRHFFNSLLMNFFSKNFGETEFYLRMGSTLSFIIYFFSSLKISNYFKPNFKIHVLIALTLSPFLLDFFSLARGYGLSIATLLLSLSFLYDTIKSSTFLSLFLTLLFGSISVISNLTFINYFLPLIATLTLAIISNTLSLKHKVIKISFIFLLFSMFMTLITPILFELKKTENLYFGGRENFLSDTIFSLGKSFSYHQKYGFLLQFIFIILFLLSIGISIWKVYKAFIEKKLNSDLFLSVLFILSILSPVTQHLIFDTHFVVERTALFYFPILILIILDALSKSENLKIKPLKYILSILFILHFINSMNITHTYSWRYDSGTKQVLSDLKVITKDQQILLGVDHFRTSSMNFYKNKLRYNDLWVSNVTLGTWNYPLNLEELNPYYYGQNEKRNTDKSVHIKDIISSEIHYYYLDNNLLHLLRLKNVKYRVIKEYKYARATLIKISKPNSIIK